MFNFFCHFVIIIIIITIISAIIIFVVLYSVIFANRSFWQEKRTKLPKFGGGRSGCLGNPQKKTFFLGRCSLFQNIIAIKQCLANYCKNLFLRLRWPRKTSLRRRSSLKTLEMATLLPTNRYLGVFCLLLTNRYFFDIFIFLKTFEMNIQLLTKRY